MTDLDWEPPDQVVDVLWGNDGQEWNVFLLAHPVACVPNGPFVQVGGLTVSEAEVLATQLLDAVADIYRRTGETQ